MRVLNSIQDFPLAENFALSSYNEIKNKRRPVRSRSGLLLFGAPSQKWKTALEKTPLS
jgi:hypothetical protein